MTLDRSDAVASRSRGLIHRLGRGPRGIVISGEPHFAQWAHPFDGLGIQIMRLVGRQSRVIRELAVDDDVDLGAQRI